MTEPTGHGIADENDSTVVCECGKTFFGYTVQRARESHGRHVNLQRARAILEEAKRKAGS